MPTEPNAPEPMSLLLDLGVPFRSGARGLLAEAQALNRMRLWSEHFERVTICAPLLPSGDPDPSTIVWADATELLEAGRVYFEPFPWGYHPREHCRHRREVRARLDVLVAQHRYLCFSNLGVFGTWGNFAVDAARRQNRCYSLWFDWVLHEMAAAHGGSAKARLKDLLYGMWTKRITNRAVRGCSLGLFHGKTVSNFAAGDCFFGSRYSLECRRGHLVQMGSFSRRVVVQKRTPLRALFRPKRSTENT